MIMMAAILAGACMPTSYSSPDREFHGDAILEVPDSLVAPPRRHPSKESIVASPLVEAWEMSNEANLFLLEGIAAEALQDRYSPRTRTVAAQFAHMHNVRLRWLGVSAPALAAKATPFDKDAEPRTATPPAR
jgi:hypothetical protein